MNQVKWAYFTLFNQQNWSAQPVTKLGVLPKMICLDYVPIEQAHA